MADAAAADAFIYIRCAAEGGIGEDNVAANVRADARAGGADLLEQGYLSEGSDDLLLMEATRSSDLLPGADDDEEEENHFGDLIPEGGSTYSRTGSAGSLFAANNILGGVTAAAVAGVGVRSAGSSPALMLTSNVLSAASLIDDRHFLALDAPPPQPQPQGAHTPQLSQVNSERISRPVTPASVYSHSAHSTPSRRSPFAMTAGAAAPAPTPPTFPTTFTPSTFTTTASSRCSPSAASAAAAEPPVTPAPQQAALPVDEHRDKILQHVRAHPVTIINGMTGCGKSTRIPVMILEDSRHHRHHKHHHHHHHSSSSAVAPSNGSASTGADDTSSSGACGDVSSAGGGDAFVMVSQPRRIAASALKNRLAQTLGDTVGLRLGHGKREESPNTRIWFVTTGYLVRLLAHKMHTFARYSHLVIDEIHERSLDCDLLCYLAKRLLHAFPHIKIVLMSATAHSAMFQSYFDTPHDPIFVGVRRFPLKEYFGEDLYSFLPSAAQKTLSRLLESTSRCNQRLIEEVVPDNIVKDQLAVAAVLARAIAKPGGAVLIFVSGMSDITELMEIMSSNLQNQKRNGATR